MSCSETAVGIREPRRPRPRFPAHSCPLWPCAAPKRREEGHRGHQLRGLQRADSASCDSEEQAVRVTLSNLTGSAFLQPSFYFPPIPISPLPYPGGSLRGCICSLMGRQMSLSRAEGHPSMHQAAKPNSSFWEHFSSSQAHVAPA